MTDKSPVEQVVNRRNLSENTWLQRKKMIGSIEDLDLVTFHKENKGRL